jgi:HAD superfamily hydrolase (TIGR01549 family)
MKRIIFDIDDTILMWKSEYALYSIKIFDKYNIKYDSEFLKKFDNIIDNYTDKEYVLSKGKLLNAINTGLNTNFSFAFIDDVINEVNKCYEEASYELVSTLEYLSKRYDVVALSNWFSESQLKRLERAGIAKYFNNVYGPPDVLLKPHPASFTTAMGPYRPNECIMIGDSIKDDMVTSKEVGMDTILCNLKKKNIEYSGKMIYKIEELKDLL